MNNSSRLNPIPHPTTGCLTACRVCSGTRLEPVVDLGTQPWGNHFLRPEEAGTEPFYPLCVVHCRDCRTAQLDFTVPKEVLFSGHTYLSGITSALSSHFADVAACVDAAFCRDRQEKSVLDIGSNDGTQLQHYKALGYQVLGIESSAPTAKIANEHGIDTVHAFFNHKTAENLHRKFDVINAAGVFFHLEELHSAAEGIRECLKADGVFVVQFLYMKRIMENLAFDQIYHEHLLYYNLATIDVLLRLHGLSIFDAYLSPIHGGSVIGFVTHAGRRTVTDRLNSLLVEEDEAGSNEVETYRRFALEIPRKKEQNLQFVHQARNQGKRIFGFGAPVKGNTLLNYFRLGPEQIECLVEKNSTRRGLVSPGMHIPVVMDWELTDLPDIYYVLAWNFKREILERNADLLTLGVEFYFPVHAEGV